LLIIAVILVTLGIAGIFSLSLFSGHQRFYGMPPMMGMRDMMNGGMMGQEMISRDHMRDMMQRMMPGMLPPPGIRPGNLPDPDSRGAKLLDYYCSQCHYLPNPAMHSAEEWPQIAGRMFARMSMMGGMMGVENPTAEERQQMLAYLKEHSMRSISPGSLPSPESSGAILFTDICSQCHSLPDPKLHTAEEWPKVVERMQANMQSMGKKVISDPERKEIIDYLAQNARK
jgi:cytochrome c2